MHTGNRSIATGMVWILACISAAPLTAPIAQAGASFAQAPEARPTIKLTMEDQHVIKEFTLKATDVPRSSTGPVNLTVGTTLPAGIPLQPFPDEAVKKVPQLKGHQFFAQGDRIFVVDPTRTIAEAIARDER